MRATDDSCSGARGLHEKRKVRELFALPVLRFDSSSNICHLSSFASKTLHYRAMDLLKFALIMSAETHEDEILSIEQLTDYLAVTDRTIDRLAAARKAPIFQGQQDVAVPNGGHLRLDRSPIRTAGGEMSAHQIKPSRMAV